MLKGYEYQGRFFETELSELVSEKDSLVQLSAGINWDELTNKFSNHYDLKNGRPGVPIRALVGLLILKYLHGVSDVEAMYNLLRMPTWQYFCGYRYHFKDEAPFERSLLSIFRKKIGEDGARAIFEASCNLAIKTKLLSESESRKIHVDTTVQEKNITYPHSVKLLNSMLRKLRKSAKKKGVELKQSYLRVSQRFAIKALRYSNARQFKRMKSCIKKLCTFCGRLSRDIERKIGGNVELENYFKPQLELSKKICFQSTNKVPSKEYVYSLHEQHVECISKGKAHKKYEFGNKVSIAITHKRKIIIDCSLFTGNPHDSKTLPEVVQQIETSRNTKVDLIGVDLGYRGNKLKEAIHIKLKKLVENQKKFIKSHPKIEAVISHMKRKFHLGRSRLKGLMGDKINCLLSSAAYNFALIMRKKYA